MGDRAYILAKSKNIYEETKLKKEIKQLERDFMYARMLYNAEQMEERRIASVLKKEAKEIEIKKKKAEMFKARAARLKTLMGFKGSMVKLFNSKKKEDSEDLPKDYKLAPTVLLPKLTKSNSGGETLPNPGPKQLEVPTKLPKLFGAALEKQQAEDAKPKKMTGIEMLAAASKAPIPEQKERKRRHTITDLMEVSKRIKTRTQKETKEKIWPGDPKFAGSVRRPRKTPKECSIEWGQNDNVHQTNKELLALQSCSRDCQKKASMEGALVLQEPKNQTLSSIFKNLKRLRWEERQKSKIQLPEEEDVPAKGKLELSKGFFSKIAVRKTVTDNKEESKTSAGGGGGGGGLMALLKAAAAANKPPASDQPSTDQASTPSKPAGGGLAALFKSGNKPSQEGGASDSNGAQSASKPTGGLGFASLLKAARKPAEESTQSEPDKPQSSQEQSAPPPAQSTGGKGLKALMMKASGK